MGTFCLYLGLTLALEAPVYLLAFRGRSLKERLVLWVAANTTSYPLVFFYFPYLPWSDHACELAAEVWAPLCEMAVAQFLWRRVVARERVLIVLANLVSWLVGRQLVHYLLHYTNWLD